MREITPHPEQQRTYAELRSEFREDNLQNIRSQFAGKHPVGWNMIGDPTTARDGYTAEQWRDEMIWHLDKSVTQDFGLSEVSSHLGIQLERRAIAAAAHDSVTWEEGQDQDAPACQDVTTMTDEQLCNYVNQSIEESARGSL